MATRVNISEIGNDLLRGDAIKFVAAGFKVKATKILDPHTGAMAAYDHKGKWGVIATKNHVSVRGENYPYDTKAEIRYSVFARNANGGYNVVARRRGADFAIAAANEKAAETAPPVPKYNPSALPEPFGFTNTVQIYLADSGAYTLDGAYNKTVMAFRSPMVTRASVISIASFDKDLYVSESATLDPNNKAWFVVHCDGGHGRFHIISDGLVWYSLRRVKRKGNDAYRVGLTPTVSNLDLSVMNEQDKMIINAAIKGYMDKLEKETEEES